MLKFILKRLLEAIPTLLVLITVSFFMMRFAPGNPFTSERALPPEVLANIEAKYGLDKPIGMQYLTYLGNLVQGDLGPSFKYKDFTVNDLVSQALPVSAKIGSVAFLLAVTLGVTFGTIAALKQNTLIDYLLMSSAMAGVVIPGFVLAPRRCSWWGAVFWCTASRSFIMRWRLGLFLQPHGRQALCGPWSCQTASMRSLAWLQVRWYWLP